MTGKCVLIVEDEDTINLLLRRALQREKSPDCKVVSAIDGKMIKPFGFYPVA